MIFHIFDKKLIKLRAITPFEYKIECDIKIKFLTKIRVIELSRLECVQIQDNVLKDALNPFSVLNLGFFLRFKQ